MSDTGSPIKTPKQLLYAILAAFLIPIAVIVLLSQYVGNLKNPSNSSDAYTEDRANLHRTLNAIKATITNTQGNTIIDVDPIDF